MHEETPIRLAVRPRHTLTHLAVYLAALLACAFPAAAQGLSQPCGAPGVPLPILRDGKAALVPTSLPGGTALMLLDTGSDITGFNRAAAHRLRIPLDPTRSLPSQTVGGAVQDAIGLVTNLQAGQLIIPQLLVEITDTSPADGALGLDVLQRFDVEFDLANARVTLHPGGLCAGKSPPWSGRFQAIAARRNISGRAIDGYDTTKPFLMIPATLNGRAIEAMLDTGALVSGLVHPSFADELGVSETVLARDPAATAGAFGPIATLRLHRFNELQLGTERIANPVLAVGGSAEKFPLVLGMDLFLTHRVWFSFATNRVFLQPITP